MPKYDIDVTWGMDATIYGVEAKNENEAREIVASRPVPDGSYSKYSLHVDEIREQED